MSWSHNGITFCTGKKATHEEVQDLPEATLHISGWFGIWDSSSRKICVSAHLWEKSITMLSVKWPVVWTPLLLRDHYPFSGLSQGWRPGMAAGLKSTIQLLPDTILVRWGQIDESFFWNHSQGPTITALHLSLFSVHVALWIGQTKIE